MQRETDRELQQREEHDRIAPANPFQTLERRRPEHRAGKSAHQRQRRQRGPVGSAAMLAQRGERRVVHGHRHCDAGQSPRQVQR